MTMMLSGKEWDPKSVKVITLSAGLAVLYYYNYSRQRMDIEGVEGSLVYIFFIF